MNEQKQPSGVEPGPIVTVIKNPEDVESYCLRGFCLREIVYSDVAELLHEENRTYDNEGSHHMRNNEHVSTVVKAHVLKKPLFVMEQTRDDALREKLVEIAEVKGALARSNRAASEAQEAHEDAKRIIDKGKKEIERLVEVTRTQREDTEMARKISRKLEADLGKVRVAVGEMKMKEILRPE